MVLDALADTEYPKCRNSDIYLTIYIWQKHYNIPNPLPLSTLFKLPTQENIKRIRAVIQNEEKRYLPTDPKVAKARKWNEQEWRHLLGYDIDKDAYKQTMIQEQLNNEHLKQLGLM